MLSDSTFGSIEWIIMTGGEPTLREDIGLIAKLLVEKCPHLKGIAVPTNGFITESAITACHAIDEACKGSKVKYSFTISLDGLGDLHERVRGISNAFRRTAKTIEAMRELQSKLDFRLGVHCVISKVNIHGLSDLKDWCNQERVSFSFQVAHNWKRWLNENSDFSLTSKQMGSYLNILWNRIKEPAGNYYDWMIYRMTRLAKNRPLGCLFVESAFCIQPNGNVYYCPDSKPIGNILKDKLSHIYNRNLKYREWIRRNKCSLCTQSLWWPDALKRDFLHYLQSSLIRRITTKIWPRRKT